MSLANRIKRDKRRADDTVFVGTVYDLMKKEGTAEESASRQRKEAKPLGDDNEADSC